MENTTVTVSTTGVGTTLLPTHEGDPMVYILIVIAFYAVSLACLMVKYIKSEREADKLSYYYQRFIKRDEFDERLSKKDKQKVNTFQVAKNTDNQPFLAEDFV